MKGQGKHLVDDENHGSINLKMPHNWLAERERERERSTGWRGGMVEEQRRVQERFLLIRL